MIMALLSALGKAGATAGRAVGRGVKAYGKDYGRGLENNLLGPYQNQQKPAQNGPAGAALQYGGNMYQPQPLAAPDLQSPTLPDLRKRPLGPYAPPQ